MSRPGEAARAAALTLLDEVLGRGRMLDEAALPRDLSPPDRARALHLAALVLRRLGQIDAILAGFLSRLPPARVRMILRLMTAELLADGVPAHAAVSAAVALAGREAATRRLKGLVNAVGRRVAAEGPALWAAQDAPALALPGPFAARLVRAWGEEAARGIARAMLAGAPLDLTVRDPAEAPALAARLGAELLPTGSLRLARPGQVSALPGFAEGAFWVQDAAAALPVRMLGARLDGLSVLDLCAAPGSKTMQLAAAGARVTALDVSAVRMARLAENLARTGLAARTVVADALEWAPPEPFDVVVLDAPCSASGTLRRHPDILHRRATLDVAPLAALQDRLLDRAWEWLRPGGRLLFVTCSLFPQEGEIRARAFVSRHGDAEPVAPPPLAGVAPDWLAGGVLRLRPDLWADRGGMDGFFAALMRRRA
ncbi:MAG: methyltransferase domain-containing protein [Alphaproteobacteria bacterium]|nr:MAG: methyltransferase domain-containing protein [Alphaproteobacteria bacterium]